MQTTIRISASELPDLMAVLKTLFKKQKVVEVTVRLTKAISLEKKETREEYRARIDKAIKNLDEGKNTVTFTGEEFENLVAERREKYGKKK